MPSDDESSNNLHSEMSDLLGDEETAKDQQIQDLQESLEDERDARKEERFLFIVVFVVLFDIVFLSHYQKRKGLASNDNKPL